MKSIASISFTVALGATTTLFIGWCSWLSVQSIQNQVNSASVITSLGYIKESVDGLNMKVDALDEKNGVSVATTT